MFAPILTLMANLNGSGLARGVLFKEVPNGEVYRVRKVHDLQGLPLRV